MELTNKYHLHNRVEFFVHHSEINSKNDVKKVVDDIFKKQKITPLVMDLPKWSPKLLKSKSEKQKREMRKKWRMQVKSLNWLPLFF